jgi:purine-binding chemotaxis protein CheW
MNDPRRITVQASAAEVLRQRAAQLARPLADPAAADTDQMLACEVGEQRCLIELRWLREVAPLRELLPTPMSSGYVLGLVQWRGRMLPVLDLAALLGLPAGAVPPARRLLVLASASALLALAVTEVQGLQPTPSGDVEQRSQPLDSLRPEIVRGMTREGQLLLDGARLLALQQGAGP